jgi:membrane protease YdiL (CAAX protease family)
LEETQEAPVTTPANAILITGIVIAFIFPLLLSMLLGSSALSINNKVFLSRFIFWAEVGFLWLYAAKVEKQNLLIWAEKQSGLKFVLGSMVTLYSLSFAAQVIATIPTWLGWRESNQIIKQIAAMVRHRPFLILFISFTAGVTEEIIFRGYILTRLSFLFANKYVPVIISSVLFSALHYKYHSPREFIFTFLIGVIMSVHYQKYGNIKPLIAVHILIDVIGLFVGVHFLK